MTPVDFRPSLKREPQAGMKIIAAIVTSSAILVAIICLIVLNRKEASFDQQRKALIANWATEKAKFEEALEALSSRAAPVEKTRVAVFEAGTIRHRAEEILNHLKSLKVASGNKHNQSVRHAVYQMESLAELGPEAVPVIHDFLDRFEDVDYSVEPNRGNPNEDDEPPERGPRRDRPGPAGGGPSTRLHRPELRLDLLFAPSLRLGLIDVLKEIGGETAERTLAEILDASGRGVEVAYAAKALEEMAPGKYRAASVTAVQDLLTSPVPVTHPNRFDENSKYYLYSVLALHNDTTFTNTAQELLVGNDGRIDRDALAYLNGTLKKEAVPILLQAYRNNRLTNLWDRASVASRVFGFTGLHSDADALLKEFIFDKSFPPGLRVMTLQSLTGRSPLNEAEPPIDPKIVQARLKLLAGVSNLVDHRLIQARDEAMDRLSDILMGKPEFSGSEGTGFRNRQRSGGRGLGSRGPREPLGP